MCGIAGILRFDDAPVEQSTLERMQEAIACRGPDGRGTDIALPSAMVHTRLSVVDLMGGHQPMHVPAVDRHGELTLVFNGEIYNHRSLRKRLIRRGHQFVSDHCDTEVLLHGYREWGLEIAKHLHGMFAFAVWDARHRTVYLCRDRAGKKPLYYHMGNRQLTYGSMIPAVLAGLESKPDVDINALSEYLTFGYTFDASLFTGVREVPAGHWMLFEADGGELRGERYWQPPPLSRTSTKLGANQAADELIREAVAKRLEADVPLGAFLSGGIDSSLIAAIAQQQLKGQRLKTFNVAMPDQAYDESPFARAVAEHIGSEHHTLEAKPDVENDLKHLIDICGEPTSDSSILPTYWLSRATREHVTVALSGDGGDELFGGYDRYRALRLLRRHGWWLRAVPTGVFPAGNQKSIWHRLGRLANAARYPEQQRQYLDMVRLFSPQQIGWLGVPSNTVIDEPPNWEHEVDPAEAARRWDMFHYLPFDLLRKVDRASMAVALEVRCPLLDTQVYDLAGHLPLHVLMPFGQPKGLLRRVAGRYLPASIVRRPKMGFAVPIGNWFRTNLRDMLRGYLLKVDHLETIGFRLGRIERLIEQHESGRFDHTHRLFALLSLSIWMDWAKDV